MVDLGSRIPTTLRGTRMPTPLSSTVTTVAAVIPHRWRAFPALALTQSDSSRHSSSNRLAHYPRRFGVVVVSALDHRRCPVLSLRTCTRSVAVSTDTLSRSRISLPSLLTTPIIPSPPSRQYSHTAAAIHITRFAFGIHPSAPLSSVYQEALSQTSLSAWILHQSLPTHATESSSYYAIRFGFVDPSLPAPCACASQPPTLR